MNENEKVRTIKSIKFGDLDGLYDPNLQKYFLDENFWEKIVDSDIFYVIGRKGTGKSALYQWIYLNQNDENIMVSNLSFTDFPFEKLLELKDDEYSKPNQYQSIWRNIILVEIAKLIITDQSNSLCISPEYKILKEYLYYLHGENLSDLHKQATKNITKTSSGLEYKIVTAKKCREDNSEYEQNNIKNITILNRKLEETIGKFLKSNIANKKYIIQFDQLDDNYNLYTHKEEYFQSIISLFKVIYNISQSFRRDNINVKIIGYLRSDIFYSINQYDSESARWEQYKYNINWAIINRNDWNNARLLQLINKRIQVSFNNQNITFDTLFDNNTIDLRRSKYAEHQEDVFRYIIHRTFHRPRDVVKFCQCIQQEVKTDNRITHLQVRNAEKEYSLWLLSEIENEINPKLKNTKALYEFLRELGSFNYSVADFREKYKRFFKDIGVEYEELLNFLYSLGIIMNVVKKSDGKTEVYSIIRNDRSMFNRDLMIATHQGFYKGLYVSKLNKF